MLRVKKQERQKALNIPRKFSRGSQYKENNNKFIALFVIARDIDYIFPSNLNMWHSNSNNKNNNTICLSFKFASLLQRKTINFYCHFEVSEIIILHFPHTSKAKHTQKHTLFYFAHVRHFKREEICNQHYDGKNKIH